MRFEPWLNALFVNCVGFGCFHCMTKIVVHMYSLTGPSKVHVTAFKKHTTLVCLFQGPGSFLASPIRDSPGSMVQGPPLGPGPHEQLLPPGPHGRLPPPGPYRPPRPGLYHLPPGLHGHPHHHGPPLPANGHPGMPLPGPMGGEFGPRPANGHAFHPRPGPGHVIDPRGPPPPHFRPPPPHHFGPMPPPHGTFCPLFLFSTHHQFVPMMCYV